MPSRECAARLLYWTVALSTASVDFMPTHARHVGGNLTTSSGRHVNKSKKIVISSIAAIAVGVALSPVNAGTAAADPPEGCVLSDYVPMFEGTQSNYLSFSKSTSEAYDDGEFQIRTATQQLRNRTIRDMYDVVFATGPEILVAGDERLLMETKSVGLLQAATMPSGSYATVSGENPRIEYTTQGSTPTVTTSYGELNATSDVVSILDTDVYVGYDTEVLGYAVGDLPGGEEAPLQYVRKLDRPQSGVYEPWESLLISAKVCAPNPTIESWADKNGSREITGTGSLAGDEIVVTDADGNVVGTTTVGDDLAWSITPASALAVGKYALTVTQNDHMFDLSGRSEGEIEVLGEEKPTSAPAATPTKSPTIKSTKIGLPKTGS